MTYLLLLLKRSRPGSQTKLPTGAIEITKMNEVVGRDRGKLPAVSKVGTVEIVILRKLGPGVAQFL